MNRSEHRRRVPYGENGPEWEREKVSYVLDGLIVYNAQIKFKIAFDCLSHFQTFI